MSLATKYRPIITEEVIGQDNVVSVIEKKLNTNSLPNAIMFTGPSGCGKSTLAKIIAKRLNAYVYELDVATHNSIEDIKTVCEMTKQKPIGYDNLVIILDEVHRASNVNTLQPLLITLENLPKYAYIIMCTTNPEKILATIRNRCEEYKLMSVASNTLAKRLELICLAEDISYEKEALKAIADCSYGSVRQSIANLEKVAPLGATLEAVKKLNLRATYDVMLDITYAYLDKNVDELIIHINEIDDMETFVQKYFTFVLDMEVYFKVRKKDLTNLPSALYNVLDELNNDERNMIHNLLSKLIKLQYEGRNSPILRELLIATILTI